MRNKFDYISAEVQYLEPTFVCIAETWLDNIIAHRYKIFCYSSYYNNRLVKNGGGTMILVSDSKTSKQCFCAAFANDSFNVFAAMVDWRINKVLIVNV